MGLSLDVTFQGVPISIHIGDKEIAIEVREKVYSINYFVCIGQMVVLDHRTKRVKFCRNLTMMPSICPSLSMGRMEASSAKPLIS